MVEGMKLITKAIEKAVNKNFYGSQDGKRGEAKVIARLFGGSITAYILEGYHSKGEKWGGDCVYGLFNIGYGFEYGAFSLKEYERGGLLVLTEFGTVRLPFERDLSVDPMKMTLAECAKMYGETHPWMA